MKNSSALLILFSLLTSCGYTLQGGGKLPGKVDTVSVSIFKNKSSQTGAEAIFTNAMIEELMRSSSVKVLNQESHYEDEDKSDKQSHGADAIISGTIVSISFNALARTSDDEVYKRGVTAVINLVMKSRSGEVLFAVNNFTESEHYTVSSSNSINEAIVSSIVEKIARQLCRRLVSQMSDDF